MSVPERSRGERLPLRVSLWERVRADPVVLARTCRFMSQPFAVAQVFTGIEGRLVSLKDTIAAFKEILNGDHDALPESAFYSQYRRSGRPLPLYSHPHAINTDVLFASQWSEVSMTSRPRPRSCSDRWPPRVGIAKSHGEEERTRGGRGGGEENHSPIQLPSRVNPSI